MPADQSPAPARRADAERNRDKILAWLERHRAGLQVEIQDQTLDTTMAAVQGPKALELCAGMFEADPALRDAVRFNDPALAPDALAMLGAMLVSRSSRSRDGAAAQNFSGRLPWPALLGVGFGVFHVQAEVLLIAATTVTGFVAAWLGLSWREMQAGIIQSMM